MRVWDVRGNASDGAEIAGKLEETELLCVLHPECPPRLQPEWTPPPLLFKPIVDADVPMSEANAELMKTQPKLGQKQFLDLIKVRYRRRHLSHLPPPPMMTCLQLNAPVCVRVYDGDWWGGGAL